LKRYELAQNAMSAGISSHKRPFTRKNKNPQKPSRLIHLDTFIALLWRVF
jgi:hypothetical protein